MTFSLPLPSSFLKLPNVWPSTGKQSQRWTQAHGTVATRSHDSDTTRLSCVYANTRKQEQWILKYRACGLCLHVVSTVELCIFSTIDYKVMFVDTLDFLTRSKIIIGLLK